MFISFLLFYNQRPDLILKIIYTMIFYILQYRITFEQIYLMKNSSVNKLIQHLQNIYTIPSNLKNQQKLDEASLKQFMNRNYRHHWRINGITHENNTNLKRLPAKDLDNWQILRINMSKRSYQYPKKYKGIKIPAISRQFNEFNGRGKNGQLPYLYQSQLSKIQRIREKIYLKPFKSTNKIKNQMFGFPNKIISRSKSLTITDNKNIYKQVK